MGYPQRLLLIAGESFILSSSFCVVPFCHVAPFQVDVACRLGYEPQQLHHSGPHCGIRPQLNQPTLQSCCTPQTTLMQVLVFAARCTHVSCLLLCQFEERAL